MRNNKGAGHYNNACKHFYHTSSNCNSLSRSYFRLYKQGAEPLTRASIIRPLSISSSPIPSSNNGNDSSIDSLDSHLSQLRGSRLTADESQSIQNALSNLSSSTKNDDGTTTKVIKESIDIYISMNKHRIATGGQGIANPGLYVRSIVRKKLEEGSSNESKTQPIEKINLDKTHLPEVLQSNGISSTELNANCLLALSQCPKSIAKEALQAYTTQKKRREMNGTEKIANPSGYILTVLKNIEAESETSPVIHSSLSPRATKPVQSTDVINSDKLGSSMRSNEPKSTIVQSTQKIPQATVTQPVQQIPRQHMSLETNPEQVHQHTHQSPPRRKIDTNTQQQRTNPHQTDQIDAIKHMERVSMDDVDKCLSCLAKLEQPIIQLSGVGPKTEESFHKIGIFTLRDLLWHFPRSFIDRSKLEKSVYDIPDGEVGTFRLAVHANEAKSNSVVCTDEDRNDVDVIFFYGRRPQGMGMASTALKKLCSRESMIVSGKVKNSDGKLEIFNPDIVISPEKADSLGIEAVYSLSAGLTKKKMVSAVEQALDVTSNLLNLLPESLSNNVLEELTWPKLADALTIAHKPTSMSDTGLDSPARLRIAFEELQMQQAKLALERWNIKDKDISSGIDRRDEAYASWKNSPLVSSAVSSLPFTLTPSQETCLNELWKDAVSSDRRMFRLLNGDVGSGKTVLSFLIGLGCIEAQRGKRGGGVVSLLCPTQLLASQHVRTLSNFAKRMQDSCDWTIHVELLTGNVIGKQREDLFARLDAAKDNDAIFLVGTHALTTPDIVDRLDKQGVALAIVDEEQRFGVRQRQALTSCADNILSMSATPIPRSISLQRSGLMDLTLLDSEPRLIETTIVSLDNVDKVLAVLKKKVEAGSKCFWVLPRIMGSESEDKEDKQQSNVVDRYNALVDILGNAKVCYVHGQMKSFERDENLANFADPHSEACVLVGTTVIEVGIDIPDANILVVEDADRFGLSQLHQLRGRIGRQGSRSDLKCHCLLLSNVTHAQEEESTSLTRLQILTQSNKGNEIADADLLLRGPGDMLGTSQTGIKNGLTVDPDVHWHLIRAAAVLGRGFLQHSTIENPPNGILEQLIADGKLTSFYDQTGASSKQGFALRMMLTLFGEQVGDESNALQAINTIQNLDESTASLVSQEDRSIHDKIASFYDERDILQVPSPSIKSSVGLEDEQVVPTKPYVAAFNAQKVIPTKNRLNFLDEDTAICIVLDVETTGLDEKTSHVIQLAAKVLGSDDDNDLFSGMW